MTPKSLIENAAVFSINAILIAIQVLMVSTMFGKSWDIYQCLALSVIIVGLFGGIVGSTLDFGELGLRRLAVNIFSLIYISSAYFWH